MTRWPDHADASDQHLPPSSPGVRRRLDQLWKSFAPPENHGYGLLPDLAFDAVAVRARGGEALACVPRLLELLAGHQLSIVEARQAMDLVGPLAMAPEQELAVQHLLEEWWEQALRRDAHELAPGYQPAVVLGLVARWRGPMTRWLTSWLERLDGPAARHLVDAIAALALPNPPSSVGDTVDWVVARPLVIEAWRDQDDQRGQLLAWAKSETVVNGLVLVGAAHLDSGHYPVLLGDVLDLLLEG